MIFWVAESTHELNIFLSYFQCYHSTLLLTATVVSAVSVNSIMHALLAPSFLLYHLESTIWDSCYLYRKPLLSWVFFFFFFSFSTDRIESVPCSPSKPPHFYYCSKEGTCSRAHLQHLAERSSRSTCWQAFERDVKSDGINPWYRKVSSHIFLTYGPPPDR